MEQEAVMSSKYVRADDVMELINTSNRGTCDYFIVDQIEELCRSEKIYDLDKVVEQLADRTTFLKECTKYGNKDAEQQEKSYATMMMYEVAYLVDDLLEIVKGGGVDG